MKITLYPDQARDIDALRTAFVRHRAVCLQAATGYGKCHPAGTRVILYDGTTRAVEDIRVGDVLMGPDSRPRVVQAIGRGAGPLVEIRPTKGDPWRCNLEHVLSLQRTETFAMRATYTKRRSDYRGGRIVDVPVNEWLGWSKTAKHKYKLFRPAGVTFANPSRTPLPIDPYFLGVLIGDGCLLRGSVSVTTKDPEIVRVLREQAKTWGVRMRVDDRPSRCPAYYLTTGRTGKSDNPIALAIASLGLNVGSGEKFIPHRYKTAPAPDRLALLAGMIDTDGSRRVTGYDWISKSKRLAEDFAFVARSLGFAAYISAKWNAQYARHYWRVSVNGHTDTLPIRIARKKAEPRRQKKRVLRTGFTVHPAGEGAYFGFTLDGDGRYLLEDFTVTHNTVVAGWLAQAIRAKGKKILILVHRRELVAQFHKTLASVGLAEQVGVVCRGWSPTPWAPIKLAMVFSWARRKPNFDPDIIIVDEAHHIVAATWLNVLKAYPRARVLGLTATPARLDGKPLKPPFDYLHCSTPTAELVDLGRLAPVRVLRVPVGFHARGVKIRRGEFETAELDRRADEKVVGNTVNAYLQHAPHGRAIMFGVSRRHAKETAARLHEAGIPAGYAGSETPMAERDAVFTAFARRELQCVCNVALVDEGFDVRDCDTVIDVAHTTSIVRYLQRVGRGRRPGAEKTMTYLDLVGNTYRHGLPDADRIWSLDGDPKEAPQGAVTGRETKGDRLRCCKQCLTVFSPRLLACPHCGAEHDGRPVREVDVDLIEVDDGRAARPKRPGPKLTQRERNSMLADCHRLIALGRPQTAWELLSSTAREAGYDPTWARIMADLLRIPQHERR